MSTPTLDAAINASIHHLEEAGYWRTENDLDCWTVNDVTIKQTQDGLVT